MMYQQMLTFNEKARIIQCSPCGLMELPHFTWYNASWYGIVRACEQNTGDPGFKTQLGWSCACYGGLKGHITCPNLNLTRHATLITFELIW